MNEKPRHRSGYTSEETELVRSACLTVAVTLGVYLDDVVIVGGLVPSLLIDAQRGEPRDAGEGHPGTNDLDLGRRTRSISSTSSAARRAVWPRSRQS